MGALLEHNYAEVEANKSYSASGDGNGNGNGSGCSPPEVSAGDSGSVVVE